MIQGDQNVSGGAQTAMFLGTVKMWVEMRGFGFIARDDKQPDLFVQVGQLGNGVERLEKGQRVRFDVGPNNRDHRDEAKNVRAES